MLEIHRRLCVAFICGFVAKLSSVGFVVVGFLLWSIPAWERDTPGQGRAYCIAFGRGSSSSTQGVSRGSQAQFAGRGEGFPGAPGIFHIRTNSYMAVAVAPWGRNFLER